MTREEASPVSCRHGGATDVGRVRATNQDALGATDGLYVVADGMGGHSGGEVASSVAVASILGAFEAAGRRRTRAALRTRAGLADAVSTANREVIERAAEDPALHGMGTTMCALAVVTGEDGGPALAVANVGDSRVYRFGGGVLTQVSDDHSLVGDLVRAGELTRDEASRHPQRNILTRALGIEVEVMVDTWELVPVAGDRYVLCSDGLVNEVDDATMADLLAGTPDPQDAANALVEVAVATGGHDNVTVMVVDVDTPAGGPEAGEVDRSVPAATTEGRAVTARAARPSRESSRRPAERRVLTWRVGVFFATLLALVAIVVGSVWAYARSGWFVGEHDGRVAVFQGRPDGLLWFEPRLADDDGPPVVDLRELDRNLVAEAIEVDSLDEARAVVERLRERSTG